MNEIDFANAFLGDYRLHGDEIIPAYCPFCKGGDSHDQNTFALNRVNHTFNCKRGSCGARGHFAELCKQYGVEYDEDGKKEYTPKKSYKKPETKINSPPNAVKEYLHLRKITDETMTAYGIGADGNGNIVFPYYRTAADIKSGSPTYIKFRPARKINKGERKMWREKDTEPILFGMHLCGSNLAMLVICEGEIDCMSIYQMSGGAFDVVSVPSGAEDFSWLDTCADELEKYPAIAVVGDSDAPGRKMAEDIANKLPDKRMLFPDYDTYRGCKDMNELLFRYGAEAFGDVFASLREKPVKGLINIADVPDLDPTEMGRVTTGFPLIDYCTGGLFFGDLEVFTGKRESGKSTIVNQICLNIIEQKYNVCVYSGELPASRFRYKLMLCAAGADGLNVKRDPLVNRDIYMIKPEIKTRVNEALSRHLWIYDNDMVESDESNSVYNMFVAAYRKYNCRVFVVDNLMSISVTSRASEFWQNQANFITKMRKFAMQYDVLVFCIVHPRKSNANEIKDSDEVAGLGVITNIACDVFTLTRFDGEQVREKGCSAELCILKNRFYSDKGNIKLDYDLKSTRYNETGKPVKAFSWETKEKWETLAPEDDIPF